jgi:uncharacterized hydrophobic protein (TIGR00271 family)
MASATSGAQVHGISEKLGVQPSARPRIYENVLNAADIGNLNYWLELTISAGIATLGLVLNSPAVVIGAMLISPLMGPILGFGLALAAADLYLGLKSVVSLTLSIIAAISFSAALVWLLPFHSQTGEILARTQPNLLDLGVALLSGIAGAVVVCRGGGGGGITALPGVAIAVALMPPLCTVGFGVGSGWVQSIVSGAGLLFVTNLVAIGASAFVVFLLVRMDGRDIREPIDALVANRAAGDPLFRLLRNTRFAASFGHIGRLHWRVLMLVGVLGFLFVPLRDGFVQVRDEAVARNAVADVIRRLVPSETVVTRQVDVAPDRVSVRLVVTTAVNSDQLRNAERELVKRTGKEVGLSVRKVAGEEELALLRERLRAPAPQAVPDISAIRAELVSRMDGPIKEAWPATNATLVDYELGFTPAETVVHIKYNAEAPMDTAAVEMMANLLRARLDAPQLRLSMEHMNPTPTEPAPSNRRASTRR